jgi:hypothetical protein
VTFAGKGDKSNLPADLVKNLQIMFPAEKFSIFEKPACLYGEGYGPDIQKGGGNYCNDKSFVLFDILIEGWWLSRKNIENIALKMKIDIVPIRMIGTLIDMIDIIKTGDIKSRWGEFQAEGLVAKPQVELKARNGDRIITKLKLKDYKK